MIQVVILIVGLQTFVLTQTASQSLLTNATNQLEPAMCVQTETKAVFLKMTAKTIAKSHHQFSNVTNQLINVSFAKMGIHLASHKEIVMLVVFQVSSATLQRASVTNAKMLETLVVEKKATAMKIVILMQSVT